MSYQAVSGPSQYWEQVVKTHQYGETVVDSVTFSSMRPLRTGPRTDGQKPPRGAVASMGRSSRLQVGVAHNHELISDSTLLVCGQIALKDVADGAEHGG
jgi:hypothetical protein